MFCYVVTCFRADYTVRVLIASSVHTYVRWSIGSYIDDIWTSIDNRPNDSHTTFSYFNRHPHKYLEDKWDGGQDHGLVLKA